MKIKRLPIYYQHANIKTIDEAKNENKNRAIKNIISLKSGIIKYHSPSLFYKCISKICPQKI
jgi:hypothetical protein